MLRKGLLLLSESPTAKKLVTGMPVSRAMARRFVPGETVPALMEAVRDANEVGLTATANYLGEAEKSKETARTAADVYIDVLEHIAEEDLAANISVKFTQLGQAISDEFLDENLGRVLERADRDDIFIRFDMESSEYTQRTLDEFEKLWAKGWRNIGVVLQSYLRRTKDDVRRMIELGARVRLCKGAYDEPEEVAYQKRDQVDRNFVALMKPLLSEGNYPAIASHDERMIDATVEYAERESLGRERFEFQMLHGVRRDLQRELVEDGYNVRVYIPFGEAWYPYLMRRLAERPANVMFMVSSILKESPLGSLLPGRDGGKPRGS